MRFRYVGPPLFERGVPSGCIVVTAHYLMITRMRTRTTSPIATPSTPLGLASWGHTRRLHRVRNAAPEQSKVRQFRVARISSSVGKRPLAFFE